MRWWWPWARRAPIIINNYRQTIQALIQTGDRTERQKLGSKLLDELARALDASADAAQVAVWQLGMRLESQLKEQFGATNEMISTALSYARGSEEGVAELRERFDVFEARVNARLTALEREVNR